MSPRELKEILWRLNNKGYGAYKVLKNRTIKYDFGEARLTKVQADPHAPPSFLEISIPYRVHGFDKAMLENAKPFTDFLARELFKATLKFRRKCGLGYSCYIGVPKPSPRILHRSCVEVNGTEIILRIHVGLPARGRRVNAAMATDLLLERVPKVVSMILSLREREREIEKHIQNYLDQQFLRKWLEKNDLMFFVGNGSVLPRESSLSERPLKPAVPFSSPKTLELKVRLPSGKEISGMGVPRGLTVITGGGYHGKTTLLEAIQDGIYDHIEGDGRERVVSRRYTVLVKAEDGRIVSHVDISSFIRNLPSKENTEDYSSLDSSGSTSMAASINEAVELGAEQILIDEDTSATNLLYKDEVMEKVIMNEPINTLSSQVEDLMRKARLGITTIISASSSFLGLADRVILMDNYRPIDLTGKVNAGRAKSMSYKTPRRRKFLGIRGLKKLKSAGYKLVLSYTDGERFELDLTYYPRIVERGQVRFASEIIKRLSSKEIQVSEIVKYVNERFEKEGFSAFVKPVPPDLTEVDGFDIAWMLNRIYRAEFRQT